MLRLTLLTFLLATPVCIAAQAPAGFMPDGMVYDPDVVTPADAFGHELGERPVRYDQIISYFERIARSSDRVAMDTLGHSVEGRPIVRLTVTSAGNHARLDEIRARHLAASGIDAGSADEDLPVVVWLGFGVHGAEAAGLEASAPLLHHLAAGQGPEMNHVLDNTQWLLLAQHEPRVWVPAWHEWKPHFTTDFHEMGTTSVRPSTYYFSPGDAVRTNVLTPEPIRPLLDRVADYHKAALDERGTLYFTEEVYNSFYPGSGSSYPNLNGSLGSLFEVGTAHLIELDTPLGLWSLAENIDVHFWSTLTSIAAAVDLKVDLQSYRRSFRANVLEQARQDERGGFVFASPDKARLARFVELLETHQIEVRGLARDLTLDGVEYSAGDALVVPLEQEAYLVVRTIFDRVTDFEAPRFSDATAWTLPLTFGLDHAAVPQGQMSPELLVPRTGAVRPSPPAPDRASYGYAFSWTDHYAPRALYQVLDAGLIAQAAMVPVTIDTPRGAVALERGSVFVPLGRQESSADDIHGLMTRLAAEDGIEVHAVESGNTLDEGANFGNAAAFGTLRRPEVLLLFEGGIQRFDMGHLWHLLDAQMGMPVVLKQKDRIGEIDWSRYTHIILPGGRGVGLDEAATARL
ncbi:MAG: hypothetical protein LC667_20220, partial [Thioalkalivibrio sp.]|nr:hypothetical protein [Thioalkalivibrio sp.]